jgi:outer membrane protein assembly factor BamE (lipoprotein component of BamABCDE complex)
MIQKILILAFILILNGSLIGCATSTSGNEKVSNAEVVAQIKKGESTKTDVKNLLGEPTSVTIDEDSESWLYYFSSTKMTGKAFIPFANLTGETVKHKSAYANIVFDEKGIVKKITRSLRKEQYIN